MQTLPRFTRFGYSVTFTWKLIRLSLNTRRKNVQDSHDTISAGYDVHCTLVLGRNLFLYKSTYSVHYDANSEQSLRVQQNTTNIIFSNAALLFIIGYSPSEFNIGLLLTVENKTPFQISNFTVVLSDNITLLYLYTYYALPLKAE